MVFEVPTRKDFDESSKAWRENKRQVSPGFFMYICNYIHTKNNKRCRSIVFNSNYNSKRYYTTIYEETPHYHKNGMKYCKKHLNCETW
jgi:hypothetical protein